MKWASRQIKKALLSRQGAESGLVVESKYNGADQDGGNIRGEIVYGKRTGA